ncbi:MAG: lipocalin family protein [Verrucomicrobia bacterium]|nr:lipocalin family protein [Verrucomicrobiota bacterium]
MKTLLSISLLALAACSSTPKLPPLRTVDHVDLPRFMGDWYVIGTIPWFLERDNVGTMDIYSPRPDGRIDIRYVFHKKSLDAPRREMKAIAEVVDKNSNAQWAVQFLWPFKAPFLVIDLDPDYTRTTIGYPDRSLIWIMARTPQIPESEYAAALATAAAQGYDTSRIVKVPQKNQP